MRSFAGIEICFTLDAGSTLEHLNVRCYLVANPMAALVSQRWLIHVVGAIETMSLRLVSEITLHSLIQNCGLLPGFWALESAIRPLSQGDNQTGDVSWY